ncbi:stage II sporulation protein P [Robertmurraya kyonggiensis]|uniref:Stage II sporulation protein P n=1 Tax=Robertmurraya kyonggiensis TaxID=1037680 RepID=A0A4V5P376_9BACI|nr:stage II sporulation protein P [Robertmurraya kyonggiensis]TKC18850.1 stage II sporulation protein P [Robertmurraya kyonggiensis]
MQTDKDFFKLMKESYSTEPRKAFVSDTEYILRKNAKRLNRKRTFKIVSITASSVLVFVISILWLFSFPETEQKSSLIGENSRDEPFIYIYHTHNQESFNSVTKTVDANGAFHPSTNITLVGEKLSQALNNKSIITLHEKRDVMKELGEKGLSYEESYAVSREFLQSTLEENPSIKMIFDIHRDSQPRDVTTATINGDDYAKISFIVSKTSERYIENLKFALAIHTLMEEEYPGLSRGVIEKSAAENQNTYNQDLRNESLLMEIGGVDNTLEEEYRAIDILADVIGKIIKKRE